MQNFDGISISPNLFEMDKSTVFFYEEMLGCIQEEINPDQVIVHPVNNKPVTLNNRDQAITYLVEIRNKQIKKVGTKNINQKLLF